MSELGSAGVEFDPDRVSVGYGGVDRRRGRRRDALTTPPRSLPIWPDADVELVADLGIGDGRAVVLTNDLSHAYIDENAGTS